MNTHSVILVKGGTDGYANAGGEPYSEVAASLIADILGINCIPYEFGSRVSISKLFTTKKLGLVTMNDLLKYKYKGVAGILFLNAVNTLKDILGTTEPVYDMCFFDWLIKN